MADIHLGSWKEPKIRELSTSAFVKAVDACIAEKVDFLLISGDLFNTSVPPIESLKLAVQQLRRLKKAGVRVYTIAGSHDFSPSGKTMLEVLEEAGLVANVCKGSVADDKLRLEFTVDPGTGAKIIGMIGKKGMLEKKYYEELSKENLEAEDGFKIFMFHTALSELKPAELEKMESAPLSLLPRGFDYYAGGHVHIVADASLEGYKNVVYPGPTFPNSFSELEKLGCGSMYFYEDGTLRQQDILMKPVVLIEVDCDHKTPVQVNEKIADEIVSKKLSDSMVLLRLYGVLESGKTSDINLRKIIEVLEEKGAYAVLRNTSKLKTKEFSEVKIKADTTEEAEKLVVEENIGQVKSMELDSASEKELVERLMVVLDVEKDEGEKQADYEARVVAEMEKVFER